MASYFPSNGTEGDMFYDNTCAKCYKRYSCLIVRKALLEGIHPKQWVYDENENPTCLSKASQPIMKRQRKHDLKQLSLFK